MGLIGFDSLINQILCLHFGVVNVFLLLVWIVIGVIEGLRVQRVESTFWLLCILS